MAVIYYPTEDDAREALLRLPEVADTEVMKVPQGWAVIGWAATAREEMALLARLPSLGGQAFLGDQRDDLRPLEPL